MLVVSAVSRVWCLCTVSCDVRDDATPDGVSREARARVHACVTRRLVYYWSGSSMAIREQLKSVLCLRLWTNLWRGL